METKTIKVDGFSEEELQKAFSILEKNESLKKVISSALSKSNGDQEHYKINIPADKNGCLEQLIKNSYIKNKLTGNKEDQKKQAENIVNAYCISLGYAGCIFLPKKINR